MSDQQITDLSYLREMTMGDEETVLETTKIFLSNAPEMLEKLEASFADRQWDELYEQAHKIKPNLKYMGMERAYELILSIEKQANSQDISDDLGDQITELSNLCSQGFEELAAKVKEMEGH